MTAIPAYPITITSLLDEMNRAKAVLDTFLATLTAAQKEQFGTMTHYAIKDHLAHLAVWEMGIVALLSGKNRWQAMRLDSTFVELPTTHFDDLNAIIFTYHKALTFQEADHLLDATHQALIAKLHTMNDADLHLPENHWREKGGDEPDGLPLGVRIMWNTYEHIEEHLPWMRAAVTQAHLTVNHVAIVVPAIEAYLGFWRDALGLPVGEQQDVSQEGVRIAFLSAGDTHIELVQPINDTSGIAVYLAKKGAGMHHLCFDVPDIVEAMARLRVYGAVLLSEDYQTRDGRKYIFVHPKSSGGVLVELYERL